MLSLFVLEDYNCIYSNIPSSMVKACVVVDIVLGCLFSLLLAIISLLALLLAVCFSGVYYYKVCKFLDVKKELVCHGESFLDKGFVINKLLEIGLLLVPCFGFLSLFFLKVYGENKNSFWEKGLYINASLTCLPFAIFHARLTSKNVNVRV